MSRIYIASDHAGLELKVKLVTTLSTWKFSDIYQVSDLGPQTTDSVDYPDFADLVCVQLKDAQPEDVGILVCGSGQGMAIRANRYPYIRAALCWNPQIAHLAREHNNANILCMGARTTDHELCVKIMQEFLQTPFAGGRHQQRVVKLSTPV